MKRIVIRSLVVVALIVIAAVALLRQPIFRVYRYDVADHADPAALRRHVAFLSSTRRTSRDLGELDRAAHYIADRMRENGATDVADDVFEARGHTYRNVVAQFAMQKKGKPLIIGAHYDAFCESKGPCPAADDNASGTAALIELVRLFAKYPPSQPVRVIAFTNEEPPFFHSEEMGSAYDAGLLDRGHWELEGMISLEMIGYYTAEQDYGSWVLDLLYPRRGDFVAVAGGWDDRALTRRVKAGLAGTHMPVCSITAPREWSAASDQVSYWNHGFRAVMVTDTAYIRNPNYHTPRDTPSTLDYERMARVTDGIFNAALH